MEDISHLPYQWPGIWAWGQKVDTSLNLLIAFHMLACVHIHIDTGVYNACIDLLCIKVNKAWSPETYVKITQLHKQENRKTCSGNKIIPNLEVRETLYASQCR